MRWGLACALVVLAPGVARAGWQLAGWAPIGSSAIFAVGLAGGGVLACGWDGVIETCAVWDLDRNQWTPARAEAFSPVADGRVPLHDGRELQVGFIDGAGARHWIAELRDPVSGGARIVAPPPLPLVVQSAVARADGRVLLAGTAGYRSAALLWDRASEDWTEIPVAGEVRRVAAVRDGLVAIARREPGFWAIERWESDGGWRSAGRLACADLSPQLHVLSGGALAFVCASSPPSLALLDGAGRVVRRGPAPWSREQITQQLALGGQLFVSSDARAWLWDGELRGVDAPLTDPSDGEAIRLPGDRIFFLGGLRERRLAQVWSADDRPLGPACAGEAAFLLDARPRPRAASFGDPVEDLTSAWALPFARAVTPACRRALAAGQAPALRQFLYQRLGAPALLQERRRWPDTPYLAFDGQVARLGVCGLRLPELAEHMRAWLVPETEADVRGACAAALVELGRDDLVAGYVAIAARRDHRARRWVVDPAIARAAELSPRLAARVAPVLAARRAEIEEEAARPRGGGLQAILEARASALASRERARATGLELGFELRGFLQRRWAGAVTGHLGSSWRGRLAAEATLLPFGVGFFTGESGAIGAAFGGAISGVRGELPAAFQVPVELFAAHTFDSGRQLSGWLRPAWFVEPTVRRSGVSGLPFVDELSAGARFSWPSRGPWWARDSFVGVLFTEQLRAPAVGVMLGRSSTCGSN